jgi:hypothetical protein
VSACSLRPVLGRVAGLHYEELFNPKLFIHHGAHLDQLALVVALAAMHYTVVATCLRTHVGVLDNWLSQVLLLNLVRFLQVYFSDPAPFDLNFADLIVDQLKSLDSSIALHQIRMLVIEVLLKQ